MWAYENLGVCIGSLFAAGVAEHFVCRWRHRRRYGILREAYEGAIREVQATDCAPAAVVRCTELERDFMRAWWLPWSFGLGRRVRKMVVLCAGLMLVAFALRGPVERAEARERVGRSSVGSGARPRAASIPTRPAEPRR